MISILALGIALSLDNVRVVLALAAAGTTRRVTVRVIGAFVVFEALMPIVGLAVGAALKEVVEPWADWAAISALAVSGIYILSAAAHGKNEGLPDRTWMTLGLPLSLSLDNLIAGMGLGLLGAHALTVGLLFGAATALTCAMGLVLGELASRLKPQASQVASGMALLAFAFFEFL